MTPTTSEIAALVKQTRTFKSKFAQQAADALEALARELAEWRAPRDFKIADTENPTTAETCRFAAEAHRSGGHPATTHAFLEAADELDRLAADNARLRAALERAWTKLLAYVGVCKDDKELTSAVIPMIRAALKETSHDEG